MKCGGGSRDCRGKGKGGGEDKQLDYRHPYWELENTVEPVLSGHPRGMAK